MTNQPKTMEFWYGVITFVLLTTAIILNDSLRASEKVLTLALLSAVPWAISFLARKDKEKRESDNRLTNG